MATHAVEIINEAEPDDVVSISSKYKSGKRINTDEDFASLYRYLGSTDNADFARIARARKVILVEGKDGRVIRRLAARLEFSKLADVQGTPIIQLGGFSQWRRALDAVWAFKQLLDLEIDTFCVFDRDYRSDEEIDQFLKEVMGHTTKCRVHSRKEIENHFLVPEAIRKAAWRKIKSRHSAASEPSIEEVMGWLDKATSPMRNRVLSQRIANVLQFAKDHRSGLDQSTIIEKYNIKFESEWDDMYERLKRVPGKEVLARLNDHLQSIASVTLTELVIIEQISGPTVDPDFLATLKMLDQFCTD